jgi:hypothetical protein
MKKSSVGGGAFGAQTGEVKTMQNHPQGPCGKRKLRAAVEQKVYESPFSPESRDPPPVQCR